MRLLFFLFGILLVSTAHAQTTPFTIGEVQQLRSNELNETRTLNIYLPEGYQQNTQQKYPVIYLLDGSANEDFLHMVGLVQFLTMIEQMPPTVVVGIANVDRKRDFTFPTTIEADRKAYPTTGHSAPFIRFLEKELQPYVKQHFRTNDTTTLIGQSLGGLLATTVLAERPQLFSRYVIISPSLWWDNESLLTKVKPPFGNAQVFIAVGTEGKKMEDDAKALATKLQAAKAAVTFLPMPAENHLTILHNAAYKALQVLNAEKK
ncbi:MAG: alpha/beta hydrolase [Chitinophaga sp.]|uniref:alpha/beta hydrolase n=1 Tax=Chitinophaga sp. TaxID=1869181 RepID=UPI001B2DEC73|nr:alpha/beta hydrolase-fold protein [Chitinophaga sp.]MBO9732833.1 alpha/beta hydrolase [Chitinophaga sp.]